MRRTAATLALVLATTMVSTRAGAAQAPRRRRPEHPSTSPAHRRRAGT